MKYITLIILLSLTTSYFTKHYKRLPVSISNTYIGLLIHEKIFPSRYADSIGFLGEVEQISYSKLSGDWIVHQMLGEGATAEVYLVEDTSTSQYKVMKVYAESYDFGFENSIMKRLGYKVDWMICPLSNQTLAVYEQFQNSKNLSDIDFSQRQVKIMVFKLIKELNRAHQKGIIHSDLKPDNILIDGKLRNHKYQTERLDVQIVDWNSAQLYFEGKRLKKRAGTRRYMAPQILINYDFYTPAVDVWNVGAIMFRAISQHGFIQSSNKQLKSLIQLFGYQQVRQFIEKRKPQFNIDVDKQIKESMRIQSKTYDKVIEENLTDEQATFIRKILILEPEQRATLKELLDDPYFYDVVNFEEPGVYKERKKAEEKKNKKDRPKHK